MAIAVGATWTGEELHAARRAAIAHLGYGFVPPLSEHDRENFAAEGVARTLEARAAGASIKNVTQFVNGGSERDNR